MVSPIQTEHIQVCLDLPMKVRLDNRCINIQTLPKAIILGSDFPATSEPIPGVHCIKQRTDASKTRNDPLQKICSLHVKSMMEIGSKTRF